MAKFTVLARLLPDGEPFSLSGRVAWALERLVKAGTMGVTPLDTPGPRWSAYVFTLRREHGLAIESVNESHRGLFAGSHCRYVLRSPVAIVEVAVAA
jgi:hypothetical protein